MPKGIPKNGSNKGWFKKGSKLSDKQKKKIGEYSKKKKNNLGKKLSKKWKENISKGSKGHKKTKEARLNMSLCRRGLKNHAWKGGVYKLQEHIRDIFEYRQWRSDVFTRDKFTCQKCFKKGGNLNAHHIKHLKDIVKEYKIKNLEDARSCEELWNINNGVTFCQSCHKQEHKK